MKKIVHEQSFNGRGLVGCLWPQVVVRQRSEDDAVVFEHGRSDFPQKVLRFPGAESKANFCRDRDANPLLL